MCLSKKPEIGGLCGPTEGAGEGDKPGLADGETGTVTEAEVGPISPQSIHDYMVNEKSKHISSAYADDVAEALEVAEISASSLDDLSLSNVSTSRSFELTNPTSIMSTE